MFSFLLWLITLGAVVTVPTGNVGVVTNYGRVTGMITPGIHMVAPLGINWVSNLDTRIQKDEVDAEAGSKDLQDVHGKIVVNYHLNPNKVGEIFQKIGDLDTVDQRIVDPATQEVVKAAVAKKTAEEILTKRPDLKADIDTTLKNRLDDYNVILDDVSIVNIDFSDEFNKAIEAKQVAEQRAQQAQFEADKAVKDAEAIVNKAKGEAEGQRLQQQTLTPELLQKMAIEKWDGHFPTYNGGGALPFINISK